MPACSHHLVARVYESKAEFRSALQHEKEGYTIYKTQVGHGGAGRGGARRGGATGSTDISRPLQLGEDHEKTKESSEYLKCLTQQAVALQRTMNEIYRNGSSANIPPLKVGPRAGLGGPHPGLPALRQWLILPAPQFTAPSMASVLEQLNVINGILFIPLR